MISGIRGKADSFSGRQKSHDPVGIPTEKIHDPVGKPAKKRHDPVLKPAGKSHDLAVCHLSDPVSYPYLTRQYPTPNYKKRRYPSPFMIKSDGISSLIIKNDVFPTPSFRNLGMAYQANFTTTAAIIFWLGRIDL